MPKRSNAYVSRPLSLGFASYNIYAASYEPENTAQGRPTLVSEYKVGCPPLCSELLTFDNGVVAAPVEEDAGRRLGTAVHLVSLREGKITKRCWRVFQATGRGMRGGGTGWVSIRGLINIVAHSGADSANSGAAMEPINSCGKSSHTVYQSEFGGILLSIPSETSASPVGKTATRNVLHAIAV